MGIYVNNKCTGCGICVDRCPFNAIELRDGKAVILETCTLCGSCVKACPVEAIIIEKREGEEKQDLDKYKNVWVFAELRNGEINPVIYELIGEGRKLADKLDEKLCVILIGDELNPTTEELMQYAVDRFYLIDEKELNVYNDEYYTTVMSELIETYKPSIILMGATAIGRSLGPRVASRVKTGLTADCTGLDIEKKSGILLQTRPAFGGNIMATIVCRNHRPQMATVRPGVLESADKKSGHEAEFIRHDFDTGQ
ncbi:MAG TPA: 4Fe-4S binding protein, partial [Halanaerobiales bacterium]|nr:4Fe-4S binding protein [Halanaerobiales bacterium]